MTMTVKLNDIREFNKILTSKGASQQQPVPLTLSENMVLTKSADTLMCSAQVEFQSQTATNFTLTHTVPRGETWRLCGIYCGNLAQDITNLTVKVNLPRTTGGATIGVVWHYQASLSAGVSFTGTSMGSSGIVLNEGQSVEVTGTAASSSSNYSGLVIMRAPAGFATQ